MGKEISLTGEELEIVAVALENLHDDIMGRRGIEGYAARKNEADRVQDVMYTVREMRRQHDKGANREMLAALVGAGRRA